MVKELQYTTINRVLDDLSDHPLLRDITLEQVIRHAIRFISIHGFPKFYQDKIEDVEIDNFRGLLPCDLISIVQVKDLATGICMRAMTDNFPTGMLPDLPKPCLDEHDNVPPPKDMYLPPMRKYFEEPAFKTQGRVLYVTFPKGKVGVAYKALPVDENGYPMLPDNENFLAALEAYIKKQVFTVKFDTGKIAAPVLQNAAQEYAWLAGQLASEFQAPSVSEFEAISRMMTSLIPNVRRFDRGFKHEGDREHLKNHRGGRVW